MRALIVDTGTRISPFGDRPGQTPVLDSTLDDFRAQALAAAGFDRVEEVAPGTPCGEDPVLVVHDDLLVGRELVREFVRRARASGATRAVVALEPCVYTREFGPLQDLETTAEGAPLCPMFWVTDGGPVPDGPEGCEPVVVPLNERVLKIPVPATWFGSSTLEVPVTARAALRVRHWMHILFANRIAGGEAWVRGPRWRMVLTLLFALLRAGWPSIPRILRAVSRRGKRCIVHPTAVIEASVLGDGVVIGANAVVRGSYVGDGSLVMDGANVSFSTVGARCTVHVNAVLAFSVLYDEASAAQTLMQLSVLGRKTLTTCGAYIADAKLGGGEITVVHRGAIVSSGQPFLGAAIGHGAILGSGFWIAHGREIPNGTIIVRHPSEMLATVPDDLPEGVPLAVRDGTLVEI